MCQPSPMRVIPSNVAPGHPDYDLLSRIAAGIYARTGGPEALRNAFPALMRGAIDFVLDAVRTGRTELCELDNVEKTFIGLKIEHFLRDFLDVPKGLRDLVIDGVDVDIKNTTGNTWMIPPETSRMEEPCLVIASDDATQRCWLGLIIARNAYLTKPNRDQKRGVASGAFQNILWLVEAAPMPVSPWQGINMTEFRNLRKVKGGSKRAAEFFAGHLRKLVHRSVVQALLFDQDDYMKRLRGNQGARDILRTRGIALLSGFYDTALLAELGITGVAAEEMIAVNAASPEQEQLMRTRGVID
jgi:hypothetical protein